MGKKDFTRRYARRNGSTSAEAADEIDRVIDDLLRRMRSGQPATLPGFGTLLPPDNKRALSRSARASRKKKEAQ